MNKNIIKMLILITLFFIINSNMIVLATFEDIDNHWAEDVINKFAEKEYLNGNNNEFLPDSDINKGELTSIINRYFAYGTSISQEDNLKLAEEKGYLFNSQKDENITREEVAVIMCKILSYEPSESVNKNFIDDSDISIWAKGYVYTLINEEIIIGYPDMAYKPQKNITKAELVTLLNRCIGSGGSDLELIETDIENIEVGFFAYEGEEIHVIPIRDVFTINSGDKVNLAISVPEGVEREGLALSIEGCDVVDLEEGFYVLHALKSGEARVICKSVDDKYKCEFKVIVE